MPDDQNDSISGANRRRELRHIACYPADIHRDSGEPNLSLIRDLSTTGALLFTTATLEKGQTISLELHLGEKETSEVARVEAEVVRVSPRPAGQGLWRFSAAVKFPEPLDQWRAEIEELGKSLPPLGVGEP